MRDQADDADKLLLPVLKPRRAFLDKIKQVLFRQPELALDLEKTGLVAGIVLILVRTRHGAPQIVVRRLEMSPPLLRPAALLGEIWLGAVGVAIDTMILQRMRGVQHALHRFRPVPFLAFLHVVACEAQIIEDAVGVRPLPKQIIVLEEVIMAERSVCND